MPRRFAWPIAAFAGVAALLGLPAHADDLLVSTSAGELVFIDTNGNAKRLIDSLPVLFDVAQTLDGRLFGVTGGGDVFLIDPRTAAATMLGNTGVFVNALAGTSDGGLIGAGGDGVFTVDTRTGAASPLMRIEGFQSSGDLVVAEDGAIYATGAGGDAGDLLYRIDLAAGTGTAIGAGLGFHHVYGLAVVDGTLLGVTEGRELIEIDPDRGTARPISTLPVAGGGFGATEIGEEAESPLS